MNYYNYLDEMQNLCLKACNALKVIHSDDPVLADVYSAAEEGFFQKKQNCLAIDAAAPAGSAKTERLEKFRQTVAEWEDRAAYKLKEENDAREIKRTTA